MKGLDIPRRVEKNLLSRIGEKTNFLGPLFGPGFVEGQEKDRGPDSGGDLGKQIGR